MVLAWLQKKAVDKNYFSLHTLKTQLYATVSQ